MSKANHAGHAISAIVLTLVIALFVPLPAIAADGESEAGKIDLDVLYAGNPGSDRMKDFTGFLSQHFTRVATADYERFEAKDANSFNVVIFDWTSVYPRDEQGRLAWKEGGMAMPTPPKLDQSFSRPAVLIGGAGGHLALRLQLAIDWKCLCLQSVAHDLVTKHRIFQGPLPVDLEYQEKKKPLNYYLAPGTDTIDEKMPVWKVQEKSFPEVDPGLVSSEENFIVTEDAEVIANGFNSKGPTSVAIGRHGNWLLWGFSAQPSNMTESGRHVFANAVCYIAEFDGKAAVPAVRVAESRELFVARLYMLRMTSAPYTRAAVREFERMLQNNPPTKAQLDEIGDDPAAYLQGVHEQLTAQIREKVPKSVIERFRDDSEQLIHFYNDNVEYLRLNERLQFYVDEDVQQIGVSNRTIALLDRCIAKLEAGEQVATAQRVLERYTGQDRKSASDWRRWLEMERSHLHFDELTGMFVR